MKVGPSPLRIVPPSTTESAPRRATAPAEGEPGRVALSGAATLTASLRAEAAEHGVHGDVRPGVVEAMRAEIREGRLGTPEDVERALDALMAEL